MQPQLLALWLEEKGLFLNCLNPRQSMHVHAMLCVLPADQYATSASCARQKFIQTVFKRYQWERKILSLPQSMYIRTYVRCHACFIDVLTADQYATLASCAGHISKVHINRGKGAILEALLVRISMPQSSSSWLAGCRCSSSPRLASVADING